MYYHVTKIFLIVISIFLLLSSNRNGYYIETSPKKTILSENYFHYNVNKNNYMRFPLYFEYIGQNYANNSNNKYEKIIFKCQLKKFITTKTTDGPWPMKCHDLHHTSQSQYSTADNPGIEKWRIECDWVEDTPIIANDGTIYIGGGYEDVPWYLIAVNPDGTLKWRYKTNGLILHSSPALAENGTIYFGSWDWNLYALYPNGTLRWKVNVGGIAHSSPIIGEDGTIYIGQSEYEIVAVNPNGTIRWKYKTGSWISSDPAIGDDNTIYIGSTDSYLYAMNPDGTLKWRFKTGDYIKGPPSIADDGTIYIGSWDDYLYAIYPNGTMRWKCKILATETNPSIANDGTIYIGSDRLYAINPNGTIKWSFNLGPDRFIHQSSPTISFDGTIYVGTNIGTTSGGEIIAVNPNGTEKWRKQIAYKWVESSPSIAEDGTVYIGSSYEMGRGYLHAFGNVTSNSPPESPSINGEQSGKKGEKYWYGIGAVDPDNNPVSIFIEWDDGTTSGWSREQASGEVYYYDHTWFEPDIYTIRAKTRDVMGEESDWSEFEIKISNPRNITRWLEYLDIFPIIQRLFAFIK